MKRKLLFVSFIEGGSLMAVELLGAKLFQPFYGQSLYVWSAVLAVTVGALSFGYAYGARLSKKQSDLLQILKVSLFFAGVYIMFLPLLSTLIQSVTIGLPLQMGIILSAVVIMSPPAVAFGTITPLIVQVMTEKAEHSGSWAGLFYFISTVGGVMYTFLFGFSLIPVFGIKLCLMGLSVSLLLLGIFVHFSTTSISRTLAMASILCIFLSSCSEPVLKENTTTIQGAISNSSNALLYVSRYNEKGVSEVVDSIKLSGSGVFKKEYKSVNNTMYFIKNSINNKTIPIYIKRDEHIKFTSQFRDFENINIIKPSIENKILRKFRSKFKIYLADFLRVKELISKEDITEKLANYTNDGIDLEKKYDITYQAMKTYIRNFVDTCSISDISALASLELGEEDYHFIQEFVDTAPLSNTSQTLKNKALIIRSSLDLIQNNALLRSKVFSDINGKKFKFIDENKITIVFVWASYCHESQRYISDGLRQVIKDYKNSDIRIITVSLDESMGKLKESIDNMQLDADHHYCDLKGWNTSVLSILPFNYLPTTYIFNTKGDIITFNTTETELISLLEKLN